MIIMEPKTGRSGAPGDTFPWQGCWKFGRRAWRRASYRQNETWSSASRSALRRAIGSSRNHVL